MPAAAVSDADPHRLGAAVSALGLFSKRSGKVAFGIAGALLEDGELVDVIVQGRFEGDDGVAVATDRRVLFVNDREWKPQVRSIVYARGLVVKGWQDDRTAALIFELDGQATTIDQISERELAQRMATVVRGRVG